MVVFCFSNHEIMPLPYYSFKGSTLNVRKRDNVRNCDPRVLVIKCEGFLLKPPTPHPNVKHQDLA